MLPLEQRVAVFDVDGTLWSERPQSALAEFLLSQLRVAVADRPRLAERPEYRAALDEDGAAIRRLGPVNVVLALLELHAGITPEAFESRVQGYLASARHPQRGVPLSQTRYRPMLELIGELRARDFDVYLVAASGLEFVRVLSQRYFGVRPHGVVGSQVGYEVVREGGDIRLLRTREIVGDPNEGAAKVANIRRQLGRRPILAAGNSAGDAEMLDYALASGAPSLALLLEHDDGEREDAYASTTAALAPCGPMAESTRQGGWTTVSMRRDWEVVFADT